MNKIRVGIVGLGANTRLRHVPGLRACEAVEIVGVCNRSQASTRAAALQFGIPRSYSTWREVVADADIDAVVIGTWPSLHCEVTVAALDAGKHVLTEARMARDADEARQMLAASQRHPNLTAMIVPSPIGLAVDQVLREFLDQNFIGRLQEVVVLGVTDMFADPASPLHWRQATKHSGLNVLTLGILHETLSRFVPDPVSVFAQGSIYNETRIDPLSGIRVSVDVPDALHVLTQMPSGVKGIYHLSGVASLGPGLQIHWYGSEGTIKLLGSNPEQLFMGQRGTGELKVVEIPAEKRSGWRVEQEFIGAIRGEESVKFTTFEDGLRYMLFIQAVTESLRTGMPATLRT